MSLRICAAGSSSLTHVFAQHLGKRGKLSEGGHTAQADIAIDQIAMASGDIAKNFSSFKVDFCM